MDEHYCSDDDSQSSSGSSIIRFNINSNYAPTEWMKTQFFRGGVAFVPIKDAIKLNAVIHKIEALGGQCVSPEDDPSTYAHMLICDSITNASDMFHQANPDLPAYHSDLLDELLDIKSQGPYPPDNITDTITKPFELYPEMTQSRSPFSTTDIFYVCINENSKLKEDAISNVKLLGGQICSKDDAMANATILIANKKSMFTDKFHRVRPYIPILHSKFLEDMRLDSRKENINQSCMNHDLYYGRGLDTIGLCPQVPPDSVPDAFDMYPRSGWMKAQFLRGDVIYVPIGLADRDEIIVNIHKLGGQVCYCDDADQYASRMIASAKSTSTDVFRRSWPNRPAYHSGWLGAIMTVTADDIVPSDEVMEAPEPKTNDECR